MMKWWQTLAMGALAGVASIGVAAAYAQRQTTNPPPPPPNDTIPPNTTIVSAMDGNGVPIAQNVSTNSGAITVQFSGTDNVAVAYFQGSLDGAAFQTVTNPFTANNLGQGSHSIVIRAVDTSGNVDPTPASISWTVATTPPPPPPPGGSALRKGVIVNMVSWNSTNRANIQVPVTSATSWFVTRVDQTGTLINTNIADEQALAAQIHAGGGKVDFSVGGGTQDPGWITTAINTNTTAFVNAIVNHRKAINADGVKLDIEWIGDGVSGAQMLNFITKLRQALDAAAGGVRKYYITMDMAPGEINNTRWTTLGQIEPLIDGICVMCYDTRTHPDAALIESLIDSTTYGSWPAKMNGKKNKIWVGMGITGLKPPTIQYYEDTSVTEWGQVCNWAATNGYGGVMCWDHVFMTAAHWSEVAAAFGI